MKCYNRGTISLNPFSGCLATWTFEQKNDTNVDQVSSALPNKQQNEC